MKKIVLGTIILALIVGLAYAQEQEAGQPETAAQSSGQQQEQSAAQSGGQQQAAAPSGALSLFAQKPNVLAGFGGNLNIHGMILTGIGVRQDASKTMVNPDKSDVMKPVIPDEEWRLGFLNPTWEENRFELDFHFNGGQIPGVKGVNYGWFATLWAQNYGVGNFTWAEFPYGGYKMTAPDWNQPWVELRYAGLWTSFLQDKIKLSMGRLYDEFYYMPGSKVWKTDGFPFRFSDEKTISLRAEFKPIEGLNVGLQWFGLVPFAGDENQQVDVTWPKAEDAIREIGIGIQYQNDLVSAVGGVRFDGAGDAMNKDEAKTYLPAYYGQGGNSVRLWKYDLADRLKGALPSGMNLDQSHVYAHLGPYYKHLDEIMEDPEHFEHGAWAFFSFKWQGTPGLNATAYGALYNITKFDWYGYGRFGEIISYDIVPKKLTAGVTLEQEFYGSDVFDDTFNIVDEATITPAPGMTMPIQPAATHKIVNSPYLKFTPAVTYKFTPVLSATLEGHYGICKDVLEFDYSIKPSVNVGLGALQINAFYQFASAKYVQENTDTVDVHKLGVGLMLIF